MTAGAIHIARGGATFAKYLTSAGSDERTCLNALNFCMLLTGPEAMQLATCVGWRLRGWRGGLMAGLLFVVPGALVVLALSMIYAAFGNVLGGERSVFRNQGGGAGDRGRSAAQDRAVLAARGARMADRRTCFRGCLLLLGAVSGDRAGRGAYALLAYMVQDVAGYFGWLTSGEMLDGLGLAETTPGPLILVTEFVVGVILNLTVWFAIHMLFAQIAEIILGPLRLLLPTLSSISVIPLALSALAVLLLFVLHAGIMRTLGVCAALGAVAHVAMSGALL